MKSILLQTILIGNFLLFSHRTMSTDEHATRFSINVGNITTLNLSPSTTLKSMESIRLKPHPSNSRKYEELESDYLDEDLIIKRETVNLENPEYDDSHELTIDKCMDSEFGIEFSCDPNWKWKRVEEAMLIIISSRPMVTMTITKVDAPFKLLGQITDNYLKKKGLYADGFKAERVNFLNGEAVHVKAMSRDYPDIRLSDYFFIKNGAMYGILFSVKPKEEWDKYKF